MHSDTTTTVASRAKYLYYYVIFASLNLIAGYAVSLPGFDDRLRTQLAAQPNAAQFSLAQFHTLIIVGVIFGLALAAALYTYLLRSKNVKSVKNWLVVLLVLAVLGLLVQLSHFNGIGFILNVLSVILLTATLRQVRALKE